MTQDLYTPEGVKKARDFLLNEQNNKCACLGIDILPSRKPVLDHKHDDQQFVRGVLERETNAMLGVIENGHKRFFSYWSTLPLPEILRRMADYLERPEDTRFRHPGWLKKLSSAFTKLNAYQQGTVLQSLGYAYGKNAVDRKVIFRKASLDRELGYDTIRSAIENAMVAYHDAEGKPLKS